MSLVPRFILGDIDLTDEPYGIEFGETSYGAPENVSAVLNSLLADGELLSSTRTSNRTLELTIIIDGADLTEVARAEAALALEAGRQRNTLTIDPGDGVAASVVFDTFRAALVFVRGDAMEQAGMRRFTLTIPALPFARSATLTTEVAEGIPSVGATVNAAESLTGWSAPTAVAEGVVVSPQPTMLAVDSTVFSEGTGSVKTTAWDVKVGRFIGGLPTGDARVTSSRLTLTQSFTTTAGTYLSFEFRTESPYKGRTLTDDYGNRFQEFSTLDSFAITSTQKGRQVYKKRRESISDTLLLSQAIVQALPGGFTRYTFRLPDALDITALEWNSDQLVPYTVVATDAYRPHIWVDRVAKAESATLGQQVLKTIQVGGSARTTGAIHVAAPSDAVALGQVLVFTAPSSSVTPGFKPDLRQWATSGTTTANAGGTNGSTYNTLGGSFGSSGASPIFQPPASLFNASAHTIYARLNVAANTVNTFGVESALTIGGTVVGAVSTFNTSFTPTAPGFVFIPVGTMYLPPVGVGSPAANALVRFRFYGNVSLDEVYALPTSGDLTLVDCGTGTVGINASSHLWIDAPSADQPQGGYWRGPSADRINSTSAWSVTAVPGTHTFDAGDMLAFVACTAAAGPTVSFEFFKRWLFHAAEN